MKEITEILFATETFAMGVNMPAKTVTFTHLRKYDEIAERFLKSGEYIQMNGRASRRGIDKYGYVIAMIGSHCDKNTFSSLVCGQPLPLKSSFRLHIIWR